MDFLHTEFDGGPNDVVIVALDHQANVMLLDDLAFSAYRTGEGFSYHGGWATASPVQLRPPFCGHWHVVVDLGGRGGQVRTGVRIVRDAA
ncbi:MAG: DUF1883 domain-containing protein [candidate division NC10 bacterium]|nr:DUF1883 domain-containing protein [candidate division NC10 bacterium]